MPRANGEDTDGPPPVEMRDGHEAVCVDEDDDLDDDEDDLDDDDLDDVDFGDDDLEDDEDEDDEA